MKYHFLGTMARAPRRGTEPVLLPAQALASQNVGLLFWPRGSAEPGLAHGRRFTNGADGPHCGGDRSPQSLVSLLALLPLAFTSWAAIRTGWGTAAH